MASGKWSRTINLLCLSLLTLLIHACGGNVVVLENEGGTGREPCVVGENGEMVNCDDTIEVRYDLLWNSNIATYEFNDDLASVPCSNDSVCRACLPDLDVALMQNSPLPTAPFCDVDRNATEPGRCTCGEGRCVSYSRDMSTSSVYYYCGPCGWVGARCVESNCTHEQAKCSNGYCECVQGGLFYDLSVCYYPSFGKTMIIEMLVSSLIVVAMCGVLAFSYNRLSRSRQRDDGSSTFPWRRGSGSRESPTSDTPPTYDDVVDKLPSYQDALKMSPKADDNGGITNFAFEMELSPAPPPPYEESQKRKTEEKTTVTENGRKVQLAKEIPEGASPTQTNPSERHEVLGQPIEQALQNAMHDLQRGSTN
ncbi:uncharacterized protein [Penaeus vannamei]|uniref:EGF-like domain-containing protein n=1 Tax=Penaeus vannamei TaxID=6689 RepID=A0A423T2T4_PENVA|nr:uncharacterized protein LOC113812994 [Penaeus vannamei]ROT70800.1 hypothetical protein C7M84_010902 [Penaeus vannamei]